MRSSSVPSIISVLLVVLTAATALGQELEEYRRIRATAEGLIEMIREASEQELPAIREAAVSADLALLDWLDTFITTEAFAELPPEHQAGALSDRYRWEHNLSIQLIALGRCDEARDRIRALLGEAYSDEELRPVLADAYERAVVCINEQAEPVQTLLRIEVDPPGAEVLVDNVLVGIAPLEYPVDPGEYTLTIRAEGYLAHTQTVTAEGETVAVGPVALTAAPVVEEPPPPEEPPPSLPDTGPNAAEWTLWGVGLAGISTGVALYVTARSREDDVENPPEGQFVTDPQKEQDTIDALDTWAYVSAGVGLAAAVTGLVLFLTRDKTGEEPDRTALRPLVGRSGGGVVLELRF